MEVMMMNLPRVQDEGVADVGVTTDIYDEDAAGRQQYAPVPGTRQKEQYVRFGVDDQLPYEIIRKIGQDEVTSQNKLFNVMTCYGGGLEMADVTTGEVSTDPDVRRFVRRSSLPQYFLEQITDMKYFYFSVVLVILSKDGSLVNRLVPLEACYCRLQKADKDGRVKHLYYGNFRNGLPKKVARYPLLDLDDPIGNLMGLMGKEPLANGQRIEKPSTTRVWAMLLRYPTAGMQYYPVPYYSSIFRGGSYDEKRLIAAAKRSSIKNLATVKYQIEIERGYWDRICNEEGLTDPVARQKRIDRERQNIRDFVTGVHNSGKAWVTSFYMNPDGKEVHDVKVVNLEHAKAGGDYADDTNVACNTLCFGEGVHPNLVGAVPGKSQMNNSGSDKRELFTMKQALEKSFHDILLLPLELVCEYNGWENVKPRVPMIMLTTLDEHTDAKKVEV